MRGIPRPLPTPLSENHLHVVLSLFRWLPNDLLLSDDALVEYLV
jgi:hypothetical protein